MDGVSLSKLQETVKDRKAWHMLVHGVVKSRTRLSNRTKTTLLMVRVLSQGKRPLMADSRLEAWRAVAEKVTFNRLEPQSVSSLVAQTVKRLPAMRVCPQSTRVRSLGQEDPGRRKWQPTPVSLPGESHGRRSLVGYTVHRVAQSWTRLSDFTSSSLQDLQGRLGRRARLLLAPVPGG